jgi:hypothetical protein
MSNPSLLLELMQNHYRLEYEAALRNLEIMHDTNRILTLDLAMYRDRASELRRNNRQLITDCATYQDLFHQERERNNRLEQYITRLHAPQERSVRRRLNFEHIELDSDSDSDTETVMSDVIEL